MPQPPDDAQAIAIISGALQRRKAIPRESIPAVAARIVSDWRTTDRQFIEFADKAVPEAEKAGG